MGSVATRLGRRGAALLLAAAALTALAACAGQRTPVFHPSGPASRSAVPATPRSASPQATAGPATGRYVYPAGFAVRFLAHRAGGPKRQAMIAGYENYVRAFWAGILSHGGDVRYERYLAGNALTFARRQIRYYTAHHLTIRGTAVYSGIRVTSVYFGKGAVVSACVNVAGLSAVKSASGRRVGHIYSASYLHYLEQVAEGQLPGGTWYVIHTDSYPSGTSEGAVCQ